VIQFFYKIWLKTYIALTLVAYTGIELVFTLFKFGLAILGVFMSWATSIDNLKNFSVVMYKSLYQLIKEGKEENEAN
jgi:hypothetical protein